MVEPEVILTPTHRTGLLLLGIVSFVLAVSAQDSASSPGDPAHHEGERSVKLAARTDADASETSGLADAAQFRFVLTEHQGGRIATTQGFADGAKFRLEPQDSKTDVNPQGMYAISVDGGHTTYLVNPERKEFARVDTDALKAEVLQKLNVLVKQKGLQIESPKVETVLAEPGETLDGHPTSHHKVRVSYSMHFLKTGTRLSYIEYQDLWMASDIEQKGASNLLIYFRPTGDARIDGAWERELAQMPGFPLKQVTLRTEVNEEGNSTVLRIAREITGVRTGPVPESLFVLPKGYKEVPAQETELAR
jgi:hypothetical protein